MKTLWTWAGPFVLALLMLNFLSHFGERWEFGRYGMPRSLVTDDAAWYLDGAPVDAITQHMIRQDCEEEILLGFCSFIAFGVLMLVYQMRQRKLALENRDYWCRKLQEIQALKRDIDRRRPANT